MRGLRETFGGWGGGLALLALMAALGLAALVLLGGQTSTILSSVGSSIGGPSGAGRPAPEQLPDGGGPGDTPADDPGEVVAAAGAAEAVALRERSRLVYSGTLQLVVDDVVQAAERARVRIGQLGGYQGASRTSTEGGSEVAELTFRIPSAEWDRALAALRGLADAVLAEETAAVEAGGQIVDLEARIRNLRASETVLQRIAEQAGSVPDLVRVQGELSDVRGEIERLEAQRAELGDQVAYGTVIVTFGTEPEVVEAVVAAWSPAADVEAATNRLAEILQVLTSAGIWFGIVWLPLLLLALLAVRIGWAVGTRVLRRPGSALPRPAR